MPKKNKTYAFDIDELFVSLLDGNYSKSIPNKNAIEKINELYSKGNKVIIFTARYMGVQKIMLKKQRCLGYKKLSTT